MQYEHRIYCLDEDAFVSTVKNDRITLEACPTDGGHSVSLSTASIIREIPTVTVNKESGFETNGYVSAENIVLSAGATSSVSVTKTWPMNIAMYGLLVPIPTDCIGCKLTAEVAPLTPAGTLTADAALGATILSVSPTVVAAAKPWFVLSINNGSVTELGRIAAVDTVGNTVTLVTPTAAAYSSGATLLLTVRSADQLELGATGLLEFGKGRSKAVLLQAGRSFKLTLDNPNASAARLVAILTFNY